MNIHVILVASLILICGSSVSSSKYQHVSRCISEIPSMQLMFICDGNETANDLFDTSEHIRCSRFGGSKKYVQTIGFENCEQLHVPENIFIVYYNAINLDISNVGMTTDQSHFLALANNLTRLDASHNEIDRMSDNMLGRTN